MAQFVGYLVAAVTSIIIGYLAGRPLQIRQSGQGGPNFCPR
jgi:hypothetical protein